MGSQGAKMKKKPLPEHSKSGTLGMSDIESIVKRVQKENALFDDHGHAIIGKRDEQPVMGGGEEE